MKSYAVTAAIVGGLILAGCTHSEKVSVVQPGDRAMTCTQLRSEFDRLESIKRDAERDGGVNVANVAAVLFFWPAAAGNYLNARDAQQLVEQRRNHLMTIYNEKRCDLPGNANLVVKVPSHLLAPIAYGE